MNTPDHPVAIVTGASSGIGKETAKALVAAGYRVFGTSRTPAQTEGGITMLPCDVTNDASVTPWSARCCSEPDGSTSWSTMPAAP